MQLSKVQYDAAFGDQARPSGDSADEAAGEQSAPDAADEATGAIIGEVNLEIFYNDGNKVRNGAAQAKNIVLTHVTQLQRVIILAPPQTSALALLCVNGAAVARRARGRRTRWRWTSARCSQRTVPFLRPSMSSAASPLASLLTLTRWDIQHRCALGLTANTPACSNSINLRR